MSYFLLNLSTGIASNTKKEYDFSSLFSRVEIDPRIVSIILLQLVDELRDQAVVVLGKCFEFFNLIGNSECESLLLFPTESVSNLLFWCE